MHAMYLALRATAEDVTGHENPTAVNNNISSPQFLTYTGLGHRAFTGRIRFPGRSGGNIRNPLKTQRLRPGHKSEEALRQAGGSAGN